MLAQPRPHGRAGRALHRRLRQLARVLADALRARDRRWQYRLRGGADEPIASHNRGSDVLGLAPGHPTLASLLRDAGYATALIGKWHLGFAPHFGPLKSGYQEFFGPMSGGVDYFTHCDSSGVHDLYQGEKEVHRKGYLTDLLTEEAIAFVRRARGKPFLLAALHRAALAVGDARGRGGIHPARRAHQPLRRRLGAIYRDDPRDGRRHRPRAARAGRAHYCRLHER